METKKIINFGNFKETNKEMLNDILNINLTNKDYVISQNANARYFIKFNNNNKKNESLTIEITKCYDGSIQNYWLKNKFINELVGEYYHISTYVEDEKGNCLSSYNPTIIKEEKRNIINFEYYKKANIQNLENILNQVLKLGGF